MARPTKRTPELEKRLLDALRGGNTRRAACTYAGITDETFSIWLKSFPGFLELVTHAEAQVEVRSVAILQKAAGGYETTETRTADRHFIKKTRRTLPDGSVLEEAVPVKVTETTTITRHESDWKASLEWLKRRRRDDWGDKQLLEHSGAIGRGPDLTKLSQSQLDHLELLLDAATDATILPAPDE